MESEDLENQIELLREKSKKGKGKNETFDLDLIDGMLPKWQDRTIFAASFVDKVEELDYTFEDYLEDQPHIKAEIERWIQLENNKG